MRTYIFTITAAVLACSAAAAAQTPEAVLSGPKAVRALDFIRSVEAETIAEQIKTCEIPAPPFKEQVRAAYYKQRFTELGLRNVRIDREGNVIGERPGTGGGRTLALVAHLDMHVGDLDARLVGVQADCGSKLLRQAAALVIMQASRGDAH